MVHPKEYMHEVKGCCNNLSMHIMASIVTSVYINCSDIIFWDLKIK